MKRLFTVKKENGEFVRHSTGAVKYFICKRDAKAARNELQDDYPNHTFTVGLGPDHWRWHGQEG